MPTETITRPRLPYIDLMKGVCILLIVMGHVDTGLFAAMGGRADRVFESFRVPMYYFISGIFFKTYGGLLDFTRRKVNKILVPFALFYTLAYVVAMLSHLAVGDSSPYGAFHWGALLQPLLQRHWDCNVPLWFLLSLFQVNVIYYLLRRVCWRDAALYGLMLVLAGVGYVLTWRHCRMIYFTETALTCLPFFVLGSVLCRHGALAASRHDRWGWLALPLALLLACFWGGEIDIYSQVLPSPAVFYLISSVSIVSLLWCCKNVGRLPGVNYLGRYSLIVLGTHYVLLPPLRLLIRRATGLEGLALSVVVLLALLALMFPIIAVLRRALPRLTAQRDFFKPGWRV